MSRIPPIAQCVHSIDSSAVQFVRPVIDVIALLPQFNPRSCVRLDTSNVPVMPHLLHNRDVREVGKPTIVVILFDEHINLLSCVNSDTFNGEDRLLNSQSKYSSNVQFVRPVNSVISFCEHINVLSCVSSVKARGSVIPQLLHISVVSAVHVERPVMVVIGFSAHISVRS